MMVSSVQRLRALLPVLSARGQLTQRAGGWHTPQAGLAAGSEYKLVKPLTVVEKLVAEEGTVPAVRTAAEALLPTLKAAAVPPVAMSVE
jgi:hypothetical protein